MPYCATCTVARRRVALIIAIASGCLLHAYTLAFKAEGGWSLFVVGLCAYSLAPYAAAAALARRWPAVWSAVGFAVGALAGDVFMHYSVFIAPEDSTAALGLLFMPIWNLLLLGPVGALVAWASVRVINSRTKGNAA